VTEVREDSGNSSGRLGLASTNARQLGPHPAGAGSRTQPSTRYLAKHTKGIPPENAQIAGFTQWLIRDHRVDDTTVQALRDRLGDLQLIELTGTIGYNNMVAMSLNTVELEARPGAEVLVK